MTGWRLVLAVLAVLAPACPVSAADAPPPAAEKCPDVYGVWETEYAVGRFGVEDVGPWYSGLLVRAIIGREKTSLVWMKEKFPESKDGKFHPSTYTSSVFRRITSFEQRDNRFAGKNAGGADMLAEIIDESDLLELYPDHRCMLYVGTAYPRQGGGMNFGQEIIMTKKK